MKHGRAVFLLSVLILASLLVGIYCWAAVVPRLIVGSGPKTWMEWLAVVVLSALPISIPPALIGLWQRSTWAPGAVLLWGLLLIGELALTLAAVGALAGLTGPEWFVPWTAVLAAAFALRSLVEYVRRAMAAKDPQPEE